MIWLGVYLGGIALALSMRAHADLANDSDTGWLESIGLTMVWPFAAALIWGKWAWSRVRK